jgi:type III restriction enzyme
LKDSLNAFNEIKQELGDSRSTFPDPVSVSLFRTPIDIVFATGAPEKDFISRLTDAKNAACVTSWFKSKNQAFYSIEYSFTKGTHTKPYQFNPDFFILIKKDDAEYISVVEIKSNGDDSEENIQKYISSKQHFEELNKRLVEEKINQKYFFNFLSPSSFSDYFAYLQDGRLIKDQFTSELDNKLKAGFDE